MRQICECFENDGTSNRVIYCLSEAHWRITLLAQSRVTFYACTTCKEAVERNLERGPVPLECLNSVTGFRRYKSHHAANRRYDLAQEYVREPAARRQKELFGDV
jgi:hypothetical protein